MTGYVSFVAQVADSVAKADSVDAGVAGLLEEAAARVGPFRFREVLDSAGIGRTVEALRPELATTVVRALAGNLRACAQVTAPSPTNMISQFYTDVTGALVKTLEVAGAPLPAEAFGPDSLAARGRIYQARKDSISAYFTRRRTEIVNGPTDQLPAIAPQPSDAFPPYQPLSWTAWNAGVNTVFGSVKLQRTRAYAELVGAEDVITGRDLQLSLALYVDGKLTGRDLRADTASALEQFAVSVLCRNTPGTKCAPVTPP